MSPDPGCSGVLLDAPVSRGRGDTGVMQHLGRGRRVPGCQVWVPARAEGEEGDMLPACHPPDSGAGDSLARGQLWPGRVTRGAGVRDVALGEAGTSPEQAPLTTPTALPPSAPARVSDSRAQAGDNDRISAGEVTHSWLEGSRNGAEDTLCCCPCPEHRDTSTRTGAPDTCTQVNRARRGWAAPAPRGKPPVGMCQLPRHRHLHSGDEPDDAHGARAPALAALSPPSRGTPAGTPALPQRAHSRGGRGVPPQGTGDPHDILCWVFHVHSTGHVATHPAPSRTPQPPPFVARGPQCLGHALLAQPPSQSQRVPTPSRAAHAVTVPAIAPRPRSAGSSSVPGGGKVPSPSEATSSSCPGTSCHPAGGLPLTAPQHHPRSHPTAHPPCPASGRDSCHVQTGLGTIIW